MTGFLCSLGGVCLLGDTQTLRASFINEPAVTTVAAGAC
jgi:hypothetical protein